MDRSLVLILFVSSPFFFPRRDGGALVEFFVAQLFCLDEALVDSADRLLVLLKFALIVGAASRAIATLLDAALLGRKRFGRRWLVCFRDE